MTLSRRCSARAHHPMKTDSFRQSCLTILLLGATLWLAGCATAVPFERDAATSSLTVAEARAATEAGEELGNDGGTVIWGGVVLAGTNLEGRTQFEILGYPLTSRLRPQVNAKAEGRFLAIATDYVETLDFAPGQQVTVLGRLDGVTTGKVGDASYRYPTLAIEQMHLWKPASESGAPRVGFGIGISL